MSVKVFLSLFLHLFARVDEVVVPLYFRIFGEGARDAALRVEGVGRHFCFEFFGDVIHRSIVSLGNSPISCTVW